MKKILSLLVLMCMSCIGAWADGITALSQLSNNKVYAIRTASSETARGSLYYDSRHPGYLSSTGTFWQNGSDIYDANDDNCKFAIYKSALTGNYYFYSIGAGKFVKSDGSHARLTDAIEQNITFINATSVVKNTNPWVIVFNNGGGNYLGITDWAYYNGQSDKTQVGAITYDKNAGDKGTNMAIVEVEDISSTALEAIENGVTTYEASVISDLQTKISAVYAACNTPGVKRVGYPNVTTNAATIDALYQYTDNFSNSITVSNYDTALAALNAVYAITDVYLPEDGKAYKISAVHVNADGTIADHYYLYSTAEGQITNSATGNNETYCKFIAKREGDGVVLVNELGNYLCWFDGANGTKSYSATGCNATYSATHNVLTIEHANTTCSNHPASVTGLTDLQRFGLLQMSGLQKDGTTRQYFVSDHTNNNAKHFVSGNAGDKYYGATSHTFLFQFEEVENTNKVKLSNPNEGGTSGLDGKYVGTFSAPYNVELPANVVAYTAVINDAKTVVTFNELGSVVPKGVGVLVYKEDADKDVDAIAIPAISTVEVTNNAFVAVVNGTIAAGKYVLGNGSNGVGFYARQTPTTVSNKAYLEVPAGIRSFRFDFEEQTTGIDGLQGKQSTGVAFDLAGRRINANAKGISIVNGKKYIK